MSITDTPEQRAAQYNDRRSETFFTSTLVGFEAAEHIAELDGTPFKDDSSRLTAMAAGGPLIEIAYQLTRIADALENRR